MRIFSIVSLLLVLTVVVILVAKQIESNPNLEHVYPEIYTCSPVGTFEILSRATSSLVLMLEGKELTFVKLSQVSQNYKSGNMELMLGGSVATLSENGFSKYGLCTKSSPTGISQ